LQLIPVVLTVIVINFLLIKTAPGDAASALAGENALPAQLEAVRERYGLNRPVHEQLFIYMGRVLQGDLGDSFRFREPVLDVILRYSGPTLLLVATGLVLAVGLGTLIGTFTARRAGGPLDVTVSILSVISYSIPSFWLGLGLILLFSVYLKWLPAAGMRDIMGPRSGLPMVMDVARHLLLPALTLSLVWMGQYIRLARGSVLAVLNEDFVKTARAVGFSPFFILFRVALRNAMLPVVSVLGLQLGLLLSGSVLIETVFSWPGIGRMLYEAILARDTALIMGTYIFIAVMVTVASLLTDLAYAVLDPRIDYA
jgi:peptide/nickel transport system permease protein